MDKHEIGTGSGGAKTLRKPHLSCRRDVGNGQNLGGKRKKRRQECIGSVAADPDTIENSKEAGKKGQGTQAFRKNCTSRECVPSAASDQRFS